MTPTQHQHQPTAATTQPAPASTPALEHTAHRHRHQLAAITYHCAPTVAHPFAEVITYHPDQESAYLHSTPEHEGYVLDGSTFFLLTAWNMGQWQRVSQ